MIAVEWTSDAVLDLSGFPWPGRALLSGREEIEVFLADWRSAWAQYSDHEVTVERRDQRVLAHASIKAIGRGSGARVETDVWRVEERDGERVVRARVFADEAAARAAFAA